MKLSVPTYAEMLQVSVILEEDFKFRPIKILLDS